MKINIDMELLEAIASYYEFPVAVFLMQVKDFPKKTTRLEAFKEKAEKYDRIRDIFECNSDNPADYIDKKEYRKAESLDKEESK